MKIIQYFIATLITLISFQAGSSALASKDFAEEEVNILSTPSLKKLKEEVELFILNPSLNNLKEINLWGKNNRVKKTALALFSTETQNSFEGIAKILLKSMPEYFSGLDYASFPLKEVKYRNLIAYFAYFPVNISSWKQKNFSISKNKLSSLCELYWIAGAPDKQMLNILNKVDKQYKLYFPRNSFWEKSIFLIPVPLLYGARKIWIKKPLRYGAALAMVAFETYRANGL